RKQRVCGSAAAEALRRSACRGAPARQDVAGASDSVSGLRFTAKQVTDLTPIEVTVNNVAGPNNDIADIVVRFGSIVEVYRGVEVAAVAHSNAADFIENKLARSDLIKV